MSRLVADLRYATRSLSQARLFTVVATGSIALGIAANAIVFSLVNVFLLRPPPIADPERVVRVGATWQGQRDLVVSVPEYEELRDTTTTFAGVAAHRFNQAVVNVDGEPRDVGIEVVSTDYFEVLGVPLALGGGFGSPPRDEVVVSHALWRSRLGGTPDVLGRSLRVSGVPMTVVGVAPPEFRGTFAGFDLEVWVPLASHDRVLRGRGSVTRRSDRIVNLIARLAPGVEIPVAQTQLDTVASRWVEDDPVLYDGRGLSLAIATGVHPFIATIARPFLALLQSIVGLVLLVSSANVANLLLVRGSARRREIAIRQALGAGRGRLLRQLLTENLILATTGGAAGLLLTVLAARLLSSLDLSIGIPVDLQLFVDGRVLLFGIVTALVTAALFGGLPAWRATRGGAATALRDASGPPGRSRALRLLVVAQVAITCTLLIGAGLIGRSLQRMRALDVGFEVGDTYVASASPGEIGYDEPRARDYWRRFRERIEERNDVTGVSLALFAPMGDRSDRMAMWVDGGDPANAAAIGYNLVDPAFLDLLGIPLVAGRDLSLADRDGTPEVGIVNETLARRLWPERAAPGQMLMVRDRTGVDHAVEVVGVARDVTYGRLGEPPTPFVYLPQSQWYRMDMVLHVRATGAAPLQWLTETARTLDPEVPVEIASLRDEIAFSFFVPRVLGAVLSGAGAVGLLLAAVGLFGTVAYATEQRRHEIGVRVALGADAAGVTRLVLRQSLRTTLVGLVLGGVAGLLASRLLAGFLYGVTGSDPLTYVSIFVLLVAVSVGASVQPARRALALDPAAILRRA